MRSLFPIARALRFYGSDLVIGSLASLFGTESAEYDGYGHYAKANFVQSPQTFITGPLSELLAENPLIPGVIAVRHGLTRRCPGGNQPPAPDGSSPWNVGREICSPEHNLPLDVNFP
jgi:hypothetical protein